MADRQPEAWESTAAGPYLTMRRDRGVVTIEALGSDRHRARAKGEIEIDRVIVGHGAAGRVCRRTD